MRFKWLYRGMGLLAWLPQAVIAIGLGDITVHSSLNQALDAEIQILNINANENPQALILELASQQEFESMQLARPFWLTRIQFQVEKKSDDSYCIHLRSSAPIREPIVNFLVKLTNPDGSSLLKEYLFFLDLPDMSQKKNQVEFKQEILGALKNKTSASTHAKEKLPTTKDSSLLINDLDKPIKKTVVSKTEAAFKSSYGPTAPEETIETIVQTLRTQYPQATNEQIMLGIVSKNPLSFQSGDAHQMQASVVLDLPDENSVLAIPIETAKSIIQYQKQQAHKPSVSNHVTEARQMPESQAALADLSKETPPESLSKEPPVKVAMPVENSAPVVIAQTEKMTTKIPVPVETKSAHTAVQSFSSPDVTPAKNLPTLKQAVVPAAVVDLPKDILTDVASKTTPKITPVSEPVSKTTSQITSVSESATEATPKITPVSESAPEATPKITPVSESAPEATPKITPVSEPVSKTRPQITPVSESAPETTPKITPVSESAPEVTPKITPVSEPESDPNLSIIPMPERDTFTPSISKQDIPQPVESDFLEKYSFSLILGGGGLLVLLPAVFLFRRFRAKKIKVDNIIEDLPSTTELSRDDLPSESLLSDTMVVENEPLNLDPLVEAERYLEEDDPDQAERVLQKALFSDPNNLNVIKKLIEIYANNEKIDNISALVRRIPAYVRQQDPKAWMFIHSICRTFDIPCETVEETALEKAMVSDQPEIIAEEMDSRMSMEESNTSAITQNPSVAPRNPAMSEIPRIIVEEQPLPTAELSNHPVVEAVQITAVEEIAEPSEIVITAVEETAEPCEIVMTAVEEIAEPSEIVMTAVEGIAAPSEIVMTAVEETAEPSEIPLAVVEEQEVTVAMAEKPAIIVEESALTEPLEVGGLKLAAFDAEAPVQSIPNQKETLDIDISNLRLADPDSPVKSDNSGISTVTTSLAEELPNEMLAQESVNQVLTATDADDESLVNEIVFEPVTEIEDLSPPTPEVSYSSNENSSQAFVAADDLEAKLELAKRYIDMGEIEDARELLTDLVIQGDSEQRRIALELIERL